jgi:hypothetical protein
MAFEPIENYGVIGNMQIRRCAGRIDVNSRS